MTVILLKRGAISLSRRSTEMSPLKEWYQTGWGYPTYPPSILIVGDSCRPTLILKQRLENNGCRVCQTDTRSDSLATARQHYFDLIVLNLEEPDEDDLEVCQKLIADPELAPIPMVVLTTHGCPLQATKGLKMGNVYYLARTRPDAGDTCAEAALLQIIQHIHYLTYRYM